EKLARPRAPFHEEGVRRAAGSPLLADLRALLLSFGETEIKIRYSGGSLMGVINYLKAAEALTIMPHSVVFALRKEKAITALPV
ncbi:hypothetical protein ACC730_37860, partial [Rhizobium ruizarguesonis]